jgi:hypothetical protein
MKMLIGLLILLGSVKAFAQACKVYGISNSPQHLSCNFSKMQVELSCQRGTYYMNDVKVDMAFHYDVERGPSPLVFRNEQMQLVVRIYSANRKRAELQLGNTHLRGNCL